MASIPSDLIKNIEISACKRFAESIATKVISETDKFGMGVVADFIHIINKEVEGLQNDGNN